MSNKSIIATIGQVGNVGKTENVSGKFFKIPEYQRLYEWESTHIETLLDDMKKAYDDKKEQYFIGNITTSKKSENGREKFVLIDGQQRLTTLWFIGFYLASREYKWEKEITKRVWQDFILQNDNLRITMPIRDNEEKALKELAKKIAELKDNNGKYKLADSLPSNIHTKIRNAFECIEIWFNNAEKIQEKEVKDFAEFVYTKVCFVFVELAQNTDLSRFFVRMNNRGKQLEQHEILKARMLGEIRKKYDENEKLIKDTNDEIWQKYAKIWDLCSDMNKYIFQSASDRNVFEKENKNDDTPDKVESIIDFPTFLLHCYKLWVAKKCSENEIPKEITITKDNLLEIMWDNQANKGKNKEVIPDECIFNNKNDTNGQAKANCKEFIESMLRYRVLFDYFVIKDDVRARSSNNYKIMRLSESKDNYNLPENSKKGELTSGVLHDLVMIQNYLRVARQGNRQNYHHWLTPFLKFLDSDIYLEMDLSLMENHEFDFTNFKCGAKKIAKQFSKDECDGRQKVLVRFLENLDTKLAIKQLSKPNENVLLNTTNTILININEHLNFQEEKSKIEQISKWQQQYNIFFKNKCFINNGTRTPHYWFYRLEYYLWKWGKYNQTKLEEIENKFGAKIYNTKLGESKDEIKLKDIFTKNLFHFRMLGSIEHFSAIQREGGRKDEWNLDIFGNLALISQNFNSSLSNQLEQFKKDEVIKQLKRGRLESLKYFIMCANLNGDEWTENDAQKHQNQMLDILIKSLKSSQ